MMEKLDLGNAMPKRRAQVKSYLSRVLPTTKAACLMSLRRTTYRVDLPTPDLTYTGNDLENFFLEDAFKLALVA